MCARSKYQGRYAKRMVMLLLFMHTGPLQSVAQSGILEYLHRSLQTVVQQAGTFISCLVMWRDPETTGHQEACSAQTQTLHASTLLPLRALLVNDRVRSSQECVYLSLIAVAQRLGLADFADKVRCLRIACARLELRDAILEGAEMEVELLLTAGADPGRPAESWRMSPLYLACMCNQPGIVRLLGYAGADVHERTQEGGLLHTAVEQGCSNVARVFIEEFQVDVHEPSAYGALPLEIASGKCDADMVQVLLQCRADVNRVSAAGERPLEAFIMKGLHKPRYAQQATLELLLGAGADCRKPLRAGALPEQCAAVLGMPEVAERVRVQRVRQEQAQGACVFACVRTGAESKCLKM